MRIKSLSIRETLQDLKCFSNFIIADFKKLSWYHVALILIPAIGQIPLPGGSNLVYEFKEYQYTLQDMWYFLNCRLFFIFSFVCIYFGNANKNVIIFGLIGLSCFKVIDEFSTPFNFSSPEILSWFITIIFIYRYRYKHQCRSPN